MLAFADHVGDVELVDQVGDRARCCFERAPVGAVDDLGGACADHVVDDRHAIHLDPEPRRDLTEPVRIEGEVRGALGRGQALDQLEGRGLAVHGGARERQAVVAAQTQRIERGPVRDERDGAGVTEEHALVRSEARREPLAHGDLLVADISRRALADEVRREQ